MKKEKIFIYGKHVLIEALKNNPQSIEKIFLSSRKDSVLEGLIAKNNISVGELGSAKENFDIKKDTAHQGVIGRIALNKLVKSYSEFMSGLSVNSDTSLVVLGGLQDPQNVGGIIRSAAAFGISGILIPRHNQSPITGAVIKVSAGMAFTVPIVFIDEIVSVVNDLKKVGFVVYGLDGEAKKKIDEEQFKNPAVFILGNESKGIDQETLNLCDVGLVIPMNSKCESLNVASSAAITLYKWSSHHPNAL